LRLVYSSAPFWSRFVTCFRPVSIPAWRAALILAAALSLAGCGRRGPLEAPRGSADAGAPLTAVPDAAGLPRNSEVAPIDSASVAPSVNATGRPAHASPAAPPAKTLQKSFPLDPLL
jgi:predicted small lipoprotein YifL